jgi:GGDEF domain-containing protein
MALEEDAITAQSPALADQAVMKRLVSSLRKSDTVVMLDRGLYGIILEDISTPEGSLKVVKKIETALSEPILLQGLRYLPVAIYGVSVYPQDGTEASVLVERAEEELRARRDLE